MDIDPSIYFEPSSSPPPPPATSSPRPAAALVVSLPSVPRPSVSPSSTRVSFTQQQKSGRTSAGLDLSKTMQQNDESLQRRGGGGDLQDEVARARSERAARRNLTASLDDDPRDSASARDNITNLVSSGQSQLTTGGGNGPPSLAMFMGGGQKRRVHKVNQDMTEQEKDVTEKLEREMEATRARWANKNSTTTEERPGGGMSLASLMNRQVGSVDDEPKRWQPSSSSPSSEPPVRAHTAPAASTVPPSAASTPRSLASAFGSTATGPRLNSSPQTSSTETDGSAHARSGGGGGGYAMPGLANVAQDEPTGTSRGLVEPALVEPKVFSRPAPAPSTETVTTPTPTSPAKVPPFPSKSATNEAAVPPAPQNSTLGRLRGSSIVAERLKFAEQLQQPPPPSSSPTKERGSVPASPEKRRSVLERWGRDQPNIFGGGSGTGSNPSSPTKSSATSLRSPGTIATSNATWQTTTSTTGKPMTTSPKEEEEAKELTSQEAKPTYSKPSWEHAPIGVKPASSSTRRVEDVESPIERKYSRGVALPGLGGSGPPSSPTKQRTTEPLSNGGGVRAAAMKWGRTDSDAQREKMDELKRLKESYGVKLDATEPRRPVVERAPPRAKKDAVVDQQARSSHVDSTRSVPARLSDDKSTGAPAASRDPLVNEIISLSIERVPPPRLGGEVLSLDVFHLNSPTDNPHPIEHNHILHSTEILGIVARVAPSSGSLDDVETHVWVWRGRDAKETARTEERIAKLGKKTGVSTIVEVTHRQEPRILVEAFESQLTICKGLREDFDHLAKRLFIVSSNEQVVYVEETDFTAQSLCSGYSAVLSLAGEVYAWLGEGSTSLERESCCQFAESIADGRSLSVLAEGEETQWFWHSLNEEDNVEYASANYWHRRYEDSPAPSLVRISGGSASRVSSIDNASIHLLDGGSLENFVLVPASAREDKVAIKSALEAAKSISSKWQERGFESKTPTNVLVFPTLTPRDLPFLARSIDFDLLNGGSRPRKMNVFTLAEAEKELL